MVPDPEQRNSFVFVLRIWREGEDDWGRNAWRGWVQHIHSGDRRYLQSTEELIHFIEGHAGKLDSTPQNRLK